MVENTPTELTKPEVVAASATVTELTTLTANYSIKTVEDYEAGTTLLMRVKGAQQKLEDARTSITKPMNAALKAINDFFRGPAEKLAAAESNVKRAMIGYTNEQERLRKIAQAKADEAARKETQRLQAQAAKAEASGKVEKAAALEMRAATVVAPVVNLAPPKVTGVSTREVWKFEVTDPLLVPRQYLVVDESKIRRVVGALKGDTQIAGVRVYTDKTIASASSAA